MESLDFNLLYKTIDEITYLNLSFLIPDENKNKKRKISGNAIENGVKSHIPRIFPLLFNATRNNIERIETQKFFVNL